MRRILIAVALMVPAFAQVGGDCWGCSPFAVAQEISISPIDDVLTLRNQLAALRGVQVRVGGIDQIAAQRTLAEAILELDRRLSAIEAAQRK